MASFTRIGLLAASPQKLRAAWERPFFLFLVYFPFPVFVSVGGNVCHQPFIIAWTAVCFSSVHQSSPAHRTNILHGFRARTTAAPLSLHFAVAYEAAQCFSTSSLAASAALAFQDAAEWPDVGLGWLAGFPSSSLPLRLRTFEPVVQAGSID